MLIKKLIAVDHIKNENKFYNMIQLDGNMFEVQYGRVGQNPRTQKYPIREWDSMLRQ
jgi:predicted DNA-binding WGR domain protein